MLKYICIFFKSDKNQKIKIKKKSKKKGKVLKSYKHKIKTKN